MRVPPCYGALLALPLAAPPSFAQDCEWEDYGSPCDGLWTATAVGIGKPGIYSEGLYAYAEQNTPIVARRQIYWGAHGSGTAITGVVDGGQEEEYKESFGVYGRIEARMGAGVYGESYATSNDTAGVLGITRAEEGLSAGVKGIAEHPFGRGVEGYASSDKGQVFGVYGSTDSLDGTGVGGYSLKGYGPGTGVWGLAASPDGVGVYGYGKATSGESIGLRGYSASSEGYGVKSTSPGTAVYGEGLGGDEKEGGPSIGVHGKADGEGDFAGYFEGHAFVSKGLGVGTTSPGFLLHVNGSAGKPGGGTWSVASDARLKRDVETVEHALERLLELRGVTFEYIDPQAIGELEGRRLGMIAQEVERAFPDWVDEDEAGMKRLTVRGFEALAVEAFRELRAEKDAQIAGLEERLADLERRLADLEGALASPAADER